LGIATTVVNLTETWWSIE